MTKETLTNDTSQKRVDEKEKHRHDTAEERKRCAAIVRRAIVRHRDNIMHVQILKRVLEKIVNPRTK